MPVKSQLRDNKILMSEVNNHLRYNGSCMFLPAVLIFETVIFLGKRGNFVMLVKRDNRPALVGGKTT